MSENATEDKCPYCGSFDTETGGVSIDDGFVVWNALCKDCEKLFKAYYTIDFCKNVDWESD